MVDSFLSESGRLRERRAWLETVPMPGGTEACDFSHGISLSSESEEDIQEIISEKFVPGNAHVIFEIEQFFLVQ